MTCNQTKDKYYKHNKTDQINAYSELSFHDMNN